MDGLNSPKELCQAALDAGQTAIAITDHGTLSSHRDMQIAAKELGIKFIKSDNNYILSSGDSNNIIPPECLLLISK